MEGQQSAVELTASNSDLMFLYREHESDLMRTDSKSSLNVLKEYEPSKGG
jgi:hypothetical protein